MKLLFVLLIFVLAEAFELAGQPDPKLGDPLLYVLHTYKKTHQPKGHGFYLKFDTSDWDDFFKERRRRMDCVFSCGSSYLCVRECGPPQNSGTIKIQHTRMNSFKAKNGTKVFYTMGSATGFSFAMCFIFKISTLLFLSSFKAQQELAINRHVLSDWIM